MTFAVDYEQFGEVKTQELKVSFIARVLWLSAISGQHRASGSKGAAPDAFMCSRSPGASILR
jgi:hypothetical protein